MLPRFVFSPAIDLAAVLVLLATSTIARGLSPSGHSGALDETWMPAWQKRDLGLLDGRAPRGGRGECPR